MSRSNRHPIHRCAPLCAAILAGFALQARSAETDAASAKPPVAGVPAVVSFSVEAGSTLDVLKGIERQSGVAISVDAAAAAVQRSPAVKGTMTVRRAILAAIDGTGLSLGEDAKGALTVARLQSLDTVVVYAQRDKAETRFKADRSDTATRGGADLTEVPQSVTIITSKVLETQQTRTVLDALQNVSGVSFSQSPQGAPQFQIRANPATVTTNGLLDQSAAQADVFAVERIEVLKGPQAILSGANSMGGGVNIVSKKPQANAMQSYLVQYGSHSDATFAADLTGLVTEDKRLSYRVIGSAAKAGSSTAGYDGRSNYALTPQLRWKDPATDLIVGTTVSKAHTPTPAYTFALNGVILPRPQMKLANDADGFDLTSRKVFYQLDQKLGGNIKLISRMEYAYNKLDQHIPLSSNIEPDAESPDVLTSTFSSGRSDQVTKTFSGDHYLRFTFDTADISHRLSVGVNHSRVKTTRRQFSGSDPVAVQVYPASSYVFPFLKDVSNKPEFQYENPESQLGAYVQDMMSWGDWSLLANVRRTRYANGPGTFDLLNGSPAFVLDKDKSAATTPGVGLVYNITENSSVYASYQEGFTPNPGLSCQNTALLPQRSKNKELGLKFNLLNGKLAITMAAFNMQINNTLDYDSLKGCYNQRSGQKTNGLEFDVQGEVADGLNLIFNYTNSKASDPSVPDRLIVGQPRQKMSLWSTYALKSVGFNGWSLGAGVTANSRQEGSLFVFDRFTIPGQAQWDLSMFYENDGWSATLGIKNVFDRLLYDTSAASSYVPIRDGRNYAVSVKKTF